VVRGWVRLAIVVLEARPDLGSDLQWL
jgi:hypothetical protein